MAVGFHTSIARALAPPSQASFTEASLPDYLQAGYSSRLATSAIRAGVNKGIRSAFSGRFQGTRQQINNAGAGTRPGQQTPKDLDITFIDNATGLTGTPPTKAQLPPYSDIEPIYAPDRRTIAFASNRPLTGTGPAGDFHIWTMLSDGSFQQPLAGTQGTDQQWPTYSPDGGRIAYSSRDAQGVTQLHVIDLGSGQDIAITNGPGEKTHPSWSHSDVIAFQSTETTLANPTGLPKIWLVEFTAGVSAAPRAQLTGIGSWDSTNAGASDTEPAWEPNGAHILFTRVIGDTQRIWLMAGITFSPSAPTPAAAVSVSQLTDFMVNGVPSKDKDPAWRPEGTDYVNDFRTNFDNDAFAFASTRKSSPDPTQVEKGAISVGGTYGIYRAPIAYQDVAQFKPLTETQAVQAGVAGPAVVVAEDAQHPPFRYDNQQPSWTPELHQDFITGQLAVANRIAYSSNSGISYSNGTTQFTAPLSVFDIWTSEIIDVTPPSLLSLPSVTPRLAAPGQPVTIKAQFNDLNAGIAHVYVQIKNPNSYLQDNSLPPVRAFDTTPRQIWPYQGLDGGDLPGSITPTGHLVLDGHRIYYVYWNGGIPRPTDTIADIIHSYVGIGYQPINPQTYSYKDSGVENLPFDVTNTVTGVSRFGNPDQQPPDSLEMSLSTDPADPPGTYSVQWTTDPVHATDYYLDFITVDKVGNSLDYDNVWGFSTKQFGATGTQNNKILLVNDYMSPQEFEVPRASRVFDQFSLVPELVYDTESQLTDNPQGKGSALDPGTLNGGLGDALTALNYSLDPSATANPPANFAIVNQHNTLGPWSWVDGPPFNIGFNGLLGFVQIQREENYDQNRNLDGYDDWRILCRGPLTASVLANYGAQTIQEPGVPVSTLVPRQVSYSAVIWASPYTGDEYVGPGTIIDNATQSLLTDFVNKGGRLMLTGQDVAFALTAGGALTNNSGATFLAQVFGAQFATDGQYGNAALATLNGGPGPIYARTTPFPILTSPTLTIITEQPIFLPYTTNGFPVHINTTNADFAAIDQYFPDTVTPVTTGLPKTATVNMDLTDGAVDKTDTATQSQTVFWPCGAEGMDNDIRQIPTPTGLWENTSKRDRIVHSALCWLRQFRATGVINEVEPDGTIQAFPNALVEASVGGTVIAKALSAPDGSYVLNGLPTADVSGPAVLITAASPGFALSHAAPVIQGHGNQSISANEFLVKLEPGTIMGQVVDAKTGAPIAGATVTVTNIPFTTVTFTAKTDSNGNYVISGVPATPAAGVVNPTTYQVQVSAPGYSTVTITGYGTNGTAPPPILVPSQGTVTVNASLAPAPGSLSGTVIDPNNSLVPGATVTATPATAGASALTATTDSQGRFTFTGLAADTYTVQATATGFGPSQAVSKMVAAGASVTGVTLQLTTGTGGGTGGGTTGTTGATDTISGHVTVSSSGTSAPLTGITVELFSGANASTSGTPLQTVTTDANGLYKFTGLSDGAYTVIVLAPGQAQTPTANVTVAAATNGGAATQDFVLSPLTVFPAGIIMISLPYNYSGTSIDAATILGLPGAGGGSAPIATYDPTANQYLFYPNLPGGNGRQTQPGRGYWIKETSPMPFLTAGAPVASPFTETLAPGWNEIGDPFTTPVDWSLVQFSVPVAVGGTPANTFITLQQALVNHIVGSPLFAYSLTQQQYVQTTTLQPFQGYWVFINPQATMNQTVTLRFAKQS